jgi:hypothetical protein
MSRSLDVQLGAELFVDVENDVVLQPLHVEVNGLEKGRQASGRNSQTCNKVLKVTEIELSRGKSSAVKIYNAMCGLERFESKCISCPCKKRCTQCALVVVVN